MEDFTITHIGHTELSLPMPFKYIPAKGKTFIFQADDGTEYGTKKEGIPIIFENDFWMCAYPCTQEFWTAVIRASDWKDLNPKPSNFKGKTRPVEQVSWDDIQIFNKALNSLFNNQGLIVDNKPQIDGQFGLPSEIQWEFAAWAGQYTVFAGSDYLDDVGWYNANSNRQTMPVGLKQPNVFGLYEMSGNVTEWCENELEDIEKSQKDKLEGALKALRGAGYPGNVEQCRIMQRLHGLPSLRYSNFGFRLIFSTSSNEN